MIAAEGGLGELTEELPPVRVEATTASSAGERPHGRRFGILVHTLLATIDLEADSRIAEQMLVGRMTELLNP